MRKILLILSIVFVAYALQAQTINSIKFKAYQAVHQPVKTGIVKAPTVGGNGTIVLLTPDINLSFTQVEKQDGEWHFGGSIVPSVSYNLVIGDGKLNQDGSIDVQPYISFGAFAGYGIATNSTGSIVSTANAGGTIGIYKYISLIGGVNLLTGQPLFGLGAKISIFTFKSGSGATILSYK